METILRFLIPFFPPFLFLQFYLTFSLWFHKGRLLNVCFRKFEDAAKIYVLNLWMKCRTSINHPVIKQTEEPLTFNISYSVGVLVIHFFQLFHSERPFFYPHVLKNVFTLYRISKLAAPTATPSPLPNPSFSTFSPTIFLLTLFMIFRKSALILIFVPLYMSFIF